MECFQKQLTIAAPSLLPVLLLGESGSGKEVAARTLHSQSERARGPFIALNCGALSPALLESLLCGHVRGAFTGADRDQLGFVRAAHGGTLFLDEVGELPLEAQSRLLRILQEKYVTPVGSQKEIPVDFRLVCATLRDLETEVKTGRFRADLYFRIAVFPIRLPALRDRKDRIPEIANQLWKEACGTQDSPLTPDEIELLRNHSWPGNIRQMRNVLERYALMRNHGMKLEQIISTEPVCMDIISMIETASTPIIHRNRTPSLASISASLDSSGNNKSHAARLLGISRGSLCYQLRKHGFA